MPAADERGWDCPCLLSPCGCGSRGGKRRFIITVALNRRFCFVRRFTEFACTFDAATSWAVLAAISCEHTISSSNFPFPCTTRSAASLQTHTHTFRNLSEVETCPRDKTHARITANLHHHSGSPAHSLGRWDEAFGPAGVLSIKLFYSRCTLNTRDKVSLELCNVSNMLQL